MHRHRGPRQGSPGAAAWALLVLGTVAVGLGVLAGSGAFIVLGLLAGLIAVIAGAHRTLGRGHQRAGHGWGTRYPGD